MAEEEKNHEHKEHHHGHAEHHGHTEHHHEHKVHHTEHKKPEGFSMKKLGVWKIATTLAVLLLIISIMTGGFRGKGGVTGTVSAEEAADNALKYINDNLLQPGTTATLNSVDETSGIYSIDISVGGQDYNSYVTKDGKMLFINGIDTTLEIETPDTEPEPEQKNIQKSDKPEVELFVMSHCPFGTQAEKGIIPAVKALGGDIDFKLKFVHYAMHGEKEVTEQTKQYCIQKEQNDKLLDYLGCFLKDGESEPCLTEAKIDVEKMNSCVEEADKEFEITENLENKDLWLKRPDGTPSYPKFLIHDNKNKEYGIRGSPGLVINGAQVSSSRDSASYLATICDAFNKAPEACDGKLSSAPPSPGFGYSESAGSATTAQCG